MCHSCRVSLGSFSSNLSSNSVYRCPKRRWNSGSSWRLLKSNGSPGVKMTTCFEKYPYDGLYRESASYVSLDERKICESEYTFNKIPCEHLYPLRPFFPQPQLLRSYHRVLRVLLRLILWQDIRPLLPITLIATCLHRPPSSVGQASDLCTARTMYSKWQQRMGMTRAMLEQLSEQLGNNW